MLDSPGARWLIGLTLILPRAAIAGERRAIVAVGPPAGGCSKAALPAVLALFVAERIKKMLDR